LILAQVFAAAISAQSAPATREQAAKVIALTGQVSVTKDSARLVLRLGDSVQVGQLIMTGADGFAIFKVADGSTFDVYPDSHLIFRNTAGNWKDILDLWLGRVKLQIQQFGGQPDPSSVQTSTAVISVRGAMERSKQLSEPSSE
jgi:hypothetical protein